MHENRTHTLGTNGVPTVWWSGSSRKVNLGKQSSGPGVWATRYSERSAAGQSCASGISSLPLANPPLQNASMLRQAESKLSQA